MAGRYRQSGRTTIRVTGKVGGERRSLEFPAELAGSSSGSSYDFVERLWAVRRLGDLIDQIDMQGQNRELVDELVSLSTKYGILTPYTSFLADERVTLHASVANAATARESLMELQQVTGRSGVAQRQFKQDLMKADRAEAAPNAAFEFRAGDAGAAALGAPSPARARSAGGSVAADGSTKSRAGGPASGPQSGMAGRGGAMAGMMVAGKPNAPRTARKASRRRHGPPDRLEDVLLEKRALDRLDRDPGRRRKSDRLDPVERRLLQPRPSSEGRQQPVPEPRRAGHGQARRQGLPHRAAQERTHSLIAFLVSQGGWPH